MQIQKGEVTNLLGDWSRGDPEALRRVMPLVADELRQLAQSHLRRERKNHTLQPTALVHEVYMRLVDQHKVNWQNRSQFFAFASTLMRRILVDYAKARGALKRGAEFQRVTLDDLVEAPTDHNFDVIALDLALDELAAVDPRQAKIVELRFFGGLRHSEISEVMGISHSTIKRLWRSARLFLLQRLTISN